MPGPSNAPQGPSRLAIGRVVNGRYRLLEVLGEGGMGVVYRAEQLPLGREVALKVLRLTGGGQDSFRQRFFLEASLTSQLNHPNLVTVYDYGKIEDEEDDGDGYYLALELLRGVTLHDRLSARGTLGPKETIVIAQGILRGLRTVHRQGVVHRDLKPANVMLVPDDDGREIPKVLDFGLVKQLATKTSPNGAPVTQAGAFLGTPEYMSPDHLDPQDVDERADLYALGIMMFEMLAGAPPFKGNRPFETLVAHLTNPVPPLRRINPKCTASQELEAVLVKLLEKSRDQRYASADAALAALAKVPESGAPSPTLDEPRPKDNSSVEMVGRYMLGRTLRENDSSIWYEATQESLERPVWLQVYPQTAQKNTAKLRRAWSLLGALRHWSNPRVLDAGEGVCHGRRSAFIAYEQVRGELLSDALAHGVRLATARATRIAVDLLEALAEAHALGLVHGALRPELVALQAGDGRARLIEYDLDFSSNVSSGSYLPLDPSTLRYYAPEVLRGGRRTERADLYSVGALLYHCLSGAPLRDGEAISAAFAAAGPIELTRGPALKASGELSSSLVQVVTRAVADDPAARFDSARAFIDALAGSVPRIASPSRPTLTGWSVVKWSQEPVSLWLLDSDPVFSRPMVRSAIDQLRLLMEVRIIPNEQRETMGRLLREEKLVPPWVVLYGDMDVIIEDPLLAVLGASGEVSRVLLSTHLNVELLQRSVNFSGCDQQLALPVSSQDISAAIARMIERTRGIREHYDRLRTAVRGEMEGLAKREG